MTVVDSVTARLAGLEGLGVETVNRATDAAKGVNDLRLSAKRLNMPAPVKRLGSTYIEDSHSLGLAMFHIGDAVAENLYLRSGSHSTFFWVSGSAHRRQAVLQRGTHVIIDARRDAFHATSSSQTSRMKQNVSTLSL